jgi:hypothetical protein
VYAGGKGLQRVGGGGEQQRYRSLVGESIDVAAAALQKMLGFSSRKKFQNFSLKGLKKKTKP